MASILKNVLRFTGLVVDAPTALPHLLNISDLPVLPQLVLGNKAGFTITADLTNITVTRTADAADAVDVYTEHWHTIEEVTPLPGKLSGLVPFIASGSAGLSGGGGGSGLLETPILNQDIVPFIPGQPVLQTGGLAFAGGPNFQVVGLVKTGAPVAEIASLVSAGPLTLTTAEWDALTGNIGGLAPGARYFVKPGPAGFLTDITPTAGSGDSAKPVGLALNPTTMAVQCSGTRPTEIDVKNVPFATALEVNFGTGFQVTPGGYVVNIETAVAASRNDPAPPTNVPVTAQTGHFKNPGTYVAIGVYTVLMNPIPGVVGVNNVIWTANAFTQGHTVTLQPGFGGGVATCGVRIVDAAGALVEDSFFIHADLLI